VTLAILQGYTQTHLASGDDLSREAGAAAEHGLVRPHDAQALQALISLTRYVAGLMLANGTEASVRPSDRRRTRVLGHVTGDRPR
jgi:hypothetical protein